MFKSILPLVLLFLGIGESFAFELQKWSNWHLVGVYDGVRVEYRRRPWITKSENKTMVQWKATNTNGYEITYEVDKTYTSDTVSKKKEKYVIKPGGICDPSPDYPLGQVHNIQASVMITQGKKSEAQKQSVGKSEISAPSKPKYVDPEIANEIASLKEHKRQIEYQKQMAEVERQQAEQAKIRAAQNPVKATSDRNPPRAYLTIKRADQ